MAKSVQLKLFNVDGRLISRRNADGSFDLFRIIPRKYVQCGDFVHAFAVRESANYDNTKVLTFCVLTIANFGTAKEHIFRVTEVAGYNCDVPTVLEPEFITDVEEN